MRVAALCAPQEQRRKKDLIESASQSAALLRAPSAPPLTGGMTRQPSAPQPSLSRGASFPAESSAGEGAGRRAHPLILPCFHRTRAAGREKRRALTGREPNSRAHRGFGLGLASTMKKLATDVGAKMDNATAAVKLMISATLNRDQDLVSLGLVHLRADSACASSTAAMLTSAPLPNTGAWALPAARAAVSAGDAAAVRGGEGRGQGRRGGGGGGREHVVRVRGGRRRGGERAERAWARKV